MPKLRGQFDASKESVRVSFGGGRRHWLPIACTTEAEARERAAIVVEIVRRLHAAGKNDVAYALAKRAAAAASANELAGVLLAVDAVCRGDVIARPKFEAGITFEQFATQWTTGELHRLYPKRIRLKQSAKGDERSLKRWVYPHIGRIPLINITRDHAEDVLAGIPETRSVFVSRQVAQAIARIMRLAVYPTGLLRETPIPRGFVPPILKKRARTYLFPDEDRSLLACTEVELVKRLLYGMLAREGMRLREALGLEIADVHLPLGAVHLDRNKTNDPRAWALDRSVAEALRLWIRHFHPNPLPNARIFVYPAGGPRAGRPLGTGHYCAAAELRDHLRIAGCTRPQLFEHNEDRRRICIHDLRATFVTIALATQRTEAWVAARTGHRSSTMINEYRRLAACHEELDMSPLDPLVEAIPELRTLHHPPPLLLGAATVQTDADDNGHRARA